jgi:hypothetical protein
MVKVARQLSLSKNTNFIHENSAFMSELPLQKPNTVTLGVRISICELGVGDIWTIAK